MKHVIEFRDPSWLNEDVRALLDRTGMGFCIHDLAGVPCPPWVTGPLVYLRFHGPTNVHYAGRYTPAHLRKWAEFMQKQHDAGYEVYAYFNNDDRGYAVVNARELQGLLGVQAPAPVHLWDAS